MNRAKRKYMKLLKDYFPYGRACRKKFLVSVADDIENFVREHERCTYEMLVEEFGKPQEVILNYRKEIEISDIRNVRKLAAKYVIATACSCFLLFGVYAFVGLGAKSKNAEATTEDVASESVEIYDPIRAYLDRYGGSLYNEYGDAVITAVRPIGGNTVDTKRMLLKKFRHLRKQNSAV